MGTEFEGDFGWLPEINGNGDGVAVNLVVPAFKEEESIAGV